MPNSRYFQVPGSPRYFDRNKILLVLMVALVISLVQVSSVNNLLPIIEEHLHAQRADIQWVLSGYALAFGLLLVPAGRIGDIFGRSSMWIIGMAVFTLGCTLCSLAISPLMLNTARIIQGVGAGIFSPQVTGMIQQYFEGRARAKAFSYMGLAVSASVAVGPLISGGFVQLFGTIGWRHSFFFNVPLGLIGIISGFFLLPFAKERRTVGKKATEVAEEYRKIQKKKGRIFKGRKGSKVDLDPIGMLLLSLTVLCLMLPFMTMFWWRWFLLIIGFSCAGLWIKWEEVYAKMGRFPMVNLRLFKIESYSYGTAIGAIQFLGTTSVFVVTSMVLQQALGLSALQTGLIGLPNAILSGIFAIIGGRFAISHGRECQFGALLLAAVSVAGVIPLAYTSLQLGWSPWLMSIPLALLGLAMGLQGSVNQTVTMMQVPASHGGTAGGFQQTSQRITTAVGNAMITAILFAFVSSEHHATPHEWVLGSAVAFGTISVIVLIATLVAYVFMRRPRAGAMAPSNV
ncbi:MFS transporter [Actinotignum urinale]|uniref:MFS transporter n=1 Tax=Actinotignum urinale TaxID=190146 RepID=A0ABU5G4M8_9ACTO|nr:MFS transporter [Actinotignum urinale]MDY5129476.1 MFS transporter [Actinotignum urinale]MDY5132136.1 MFS transporter [Actinotignum urinale]MDY5152264.1 MFS transporter [Actinotignum urinale]WIK59053.1 MFS transporter [Actinotignum urinale]